MASNYQPMPAPSSGNRTGNSPITPSDRARPTPRRTSKPISPFYRQPGADQPPAGIRKPTAHQRSQARSAAVQRMTGTKGNGVNPDELAPVQQRYQRNSGKKPF